MRCAECQASLWRAGEAVPPGVYVRIDTSPNVTVIVLPDEHLPASFDGHVALYRRSGCRCTRACQPVAETPKVEHALTLPEEVHPS